MCEISTLGWEVYIEGRGGQFSLLIKIIEVDFLHDLLCLPVPFQSSGI